MGGGDEQKVSMREWGQCYSAHDCFTSALKGLEIFTKRQKMGRLATADEIAALVIYLGSEEVKFRWPLHFCYII